MASDPLTQKQISDGLGLTTPTPAPAPMTAEDQQAIERLHEWVNWSGPRPAIADKTIERAYSALTARVAELEHDLHQALKNGKVAADRLAETQDDLHAVESKLAAEAKLLDWLLAIAGGRRASIGSEDNTYCPQLSRERVDAEIRALQTKDPRHD